MKTNVKIAFGLNDAHINFMPNGDARQTWTHDRGDEESGPDGFLH